MGRPGLCLLVALAIAALPVAGRGGMEWSIASNGLEEIGLSAGFRPEPVAVTPQAPAYPLPVQIGPISNSAYVCAVLGMDGNAREALREVKELKRRLDGGYSLDESRPFWSRVAASRDDIRAYARHSWLPEATLAKADAAGVLMDELAELYAER